jgi:predicted component of type VI protein secretion system
MNYSIVVTGQDLQRLQEEINVILAGFEARVEALEAKAAPKAKASPKGKE